MILSNNKDKGRAGLSLAISYFGTNGYTVSIPLNDTQWYDLVVEKDNNFYAVQCKFTGSKNDQVSLISIGGRYKDNKEKDNVLNHPIDYLFCANEKNIWLIPIAAIKEAGIKKSFTLYSESHPSSKLNSYLYLVQI